MRVVTYGYFFKSEIVTNFGPLGPKLVLRVVTYSTFFLRLFGKSEKKLFTVERQRVQKMTLKVSGFGLIRIFQKSQDSETKKLASVVKKA